MLANKRTTGKRTKERVISYELVRLIATILVVIGHSNYLGRTIKYGGVDYTSFPAADVLSNLFFYRIEQYLITFIYQFHMPLFFILSGAVFALSPVVSFKTLVKKKAKRLILPYFVYGLGFMFPIKYASGFYSTKGVIKAMLSFFYTTEDSGHLWFLPALFFCFIIFRVLQIVFEKAKINSITLILIVAVFLYLVSTFIPTEILSIKSTTANLIWFVLGFCFENYRLLLNNYSKKQFAAICLSSVFLSVAIFVLPIFISFSLPEEIIIIALCFSVYIVSEFISREYKTVYDNKAFKLIARNLFYIYLFHDPLEYVVLKLFFSYDILIYPLFQFLYYICRIVVVIVVSIALGELIRKIKCIPSIYSKSNRWRNSKNV